MLPVLLRRLRCGRRDDEPAREVVCLHTFRTYPVVSSAWRGVCVRVRYGGAAAAGVEGGSTYEAGLERVCWGRHRAAY